MEKNKIFAENNSVNTTLELLKRHQPILIDELGWIVEDNSDINILND